MTVNPPLENAEPPWNPPPDPWHAELDGFPDPPVPPAPELPVAVLTSMEPTTGLMEATTLDIYGEGFIEGGAGPVPRMQVMAWRPAPNDTIPISIGFTGYILNDSTHLTIVDWTPLWAETFQFFVRTWGDLIDMGIYADSNQLPYVVTAS